MKKLALFALISISIPSFVQAKTPCDEWKKTGKVTHSSTSDLAKRSAKMLRDAGVSAPYLQSHFKFACGATIEETEWVLWQLYIADYIIPLEGVLTSTENGPPSFRGILGAWKDIKKVLPRKQAEKKMAACLGRYDKSSLGVGFEIREMNGKIPWGLYMRASKKMAPEGDKDIVIEGSLNLETGACTQQRLEIRRN